MLPYAVVQVEGRMLTCSVKWTEKGSQYTTAYATLYNVYQIFSLRADFPTLKSLWFSSKKLKEHALSKQVLFSE